MAAIQKRAGKDGKPKYRALVRLKGFAPESATFDRKSDAKKWASDRESAMREGRHFPRHEGRKHNVSDLIRRYLHQSDTDNPKSARTKQTQLAWWEAEIGQVLVGDVSPALLAECRDRLKDGRQSATVNRYLAVMSHALMIASREWGWIPDNPMRNVSRMKEPQGRVRFLDDAERSRLLQACRESQCAALFPMVLIAITTGARQGEILNLRWRDVDLKRGTLLFETTKNGERRAAPLVGEVLEEMRRWSKIRRIDTDFVFPAKTKDKPVLMRHYWDDAVVSANLEDFRFHDLRHTAASYLAMSGATLSDIAAILGHKTLQMVKRYSHLTDQHTAEVVNRMVSKFVSDVA